MQKNSLFLVFVLIVFGCQDKRQTLSGQWKLASYDIGIEMDLNSDAKATSDVLIETVCKSNEQLKLQDNGTIASVNTFAPKLAVRKFNQDYLIDIQCMSGQIGYAENYKIEDSKIILDSEAYFTITDDETLIRVFKDFIKVYNSEMSQVLETKDLTLTYVKI